MNWLRIDSTTLGLSGYPIQIKLLPASETLRFVLSVSGFQKAACATLSYAKFCGELSAKELAEFEEPLP